MDRTEATLGRLRRFARMIRELPEVDEVLTPLRAWLEGTSYRIVGGVAVVHHGYPRTTEDIDVLVAADAIAKLAASASAFEFRAIDVRRFEHASGVRIDLLVEGELLPRGDARYPSPSALEPSPGSDVVGLAGLIQLKLVARRHQDLADVVALLKRLDESAYLTLEAAVPAAQRVRLWELRRDALDELSFET